MFDGGSEPFEDDVTPQFLLIVSFDARVEGLYLCVVYNHLPIFINFWKVLLLFLRHFLLFLLIKLKLFHIHFMVLSKLNYDALLIIGQIQSLVDSSKLSFGYLVFYYKFIVKAKVLEFVNYCECYLFIFHSYFIIILFLINYYTPRK